MLVKYPNRQAQAGTTERHTHTHTAIIEGTRVPGGEGARAGVRDIIYPHPQYIFLFQEVDSLYRY